MQDDEFIGLVKETYDAVRSANLTVNLNPLTGKYVMEEHSTGEKFLTAVFEDEDLAVWFASIHQNLPRLLFLLDEAYRERDELENERDSIIREFLTSEAR